MLIVCVLIDLLTGFLKAEVVVAWPHIGEALLLHRARIRACPCLLMKAWELLELVQLDGDF